MNVTKAELLRLAGHHAIRRRPTLGPSDRHAAHDPTMAPTGGLTPAIVSPGLKTYVYAAGDGRVAVAQWADTRPRVPVSWLSAEAWRASWLVGAGPGGAA
jgi:hypothetical protein